jgi:hypothetical protein
MKFVEGVKLYFINIGNGTMNFLKGFDILVNAILGGDGRETISGRLGKYRHGHPGVEFIAKIVDKIFFWQYQHTENSEKPDVGDRQVWN